MLSVLLFFGGGGLLFSKKDVEIEDLISSLVIEIIVKLDFLIKKQESL